MTSDLAELVAAITDLEDCRDLRPLACWVPWEPGQGAVVRATQTHREVLALGGNRSGKTESLRATAIALALGSDHPDARQFWRNCGCDPDAYPTGPDRVYLIALASSDSLRYHRVQSEDLFPRLGPPHDNPDGKFPCFRWYNRNGAGEARAEIMVPGHSKPATVWFKSDEQGEEGVQGDAVRAILHDEEGPDSRVWQEAGIRLIDRDGWHLMANTPLRGKTWVYHDLVVREDPRRWVGYLLTGDNPYLPAGAVQRIASSDPARAAARLRGEWVAAEGLVYPVWDRAAHVVPAFPLPPEWPRFRAADFGVRNATAVLWAALDPSTRRIHLYRLHYRSGWTIAQHAERISEAEAHDPPIEYSWIDPSASLARIEFARAELYFARANNDVSAGIQSVTWRLTPGPDGVPGLVIHDDPSLRPLVEEIESYIWSREEDGTRAAETVRKVNDHAVDALRYLCIGLDGWV